MGGDFGQMDLATALTNPETIINKYKSVAIQEGTRMLLLQVAVFGVLTYFIVDSVVKRRIKR